MKWVLIAAAIGVAYFVYTYPYAVGALVKHPAELNEAAKQLNALSNAVGGIGDLVSTVKQDWAAIESHF